MESRALTLEEGRAYELPDRFLTRNVAILEELLQAYLAGEEVGEELAAYLDELREAHRGLTQESVPRLLELLMHEEGAEPGSDFASQVRYLVTRGSQLFGEGLDALEAALDPPDPTRVEAAFELLSSGNDNLCASFVKVEERQQELLRRRG